VKRRAIARGEGRRDPAADAKLRSLRRQLAAANERLAALAKAADALAPAEGEIARLARAWKQRPRPRRVAREIARLADQLALAEAQTGEREGLQRGSRPRRRSAPRWPRRLEGSRCIGAGARVAGEGRRTAPGIAPADGPYPGLREEIDTTEGRAGDVDLDAGRASIKDDIGAAKREQARRDADLRASIDTLYGEPHAARARRVVGRRSPDHAAAVAHRNALADRFGRAAKRIVGSGLSDDVCINNHEPALTVTEAEYGEAYWSNYRKAANDDERNAVLDIAGRPLWRQSRRLGCQTDASTQLGRRARRQHAVARFSRARHQAMAWTTAPHSRVLPDRFVLMAWHGNTQRFELGNPVDDIVVLGPSPVDAPDDDASVSRDVIDNSLKFGAAFDWVRDFPRAVDCGMAFRVAVSAEEVAQGFDRLLVLGLKLSADAPEAKAMLEALIDSHHYSRAGFELLQQGTPTNNTDGNDSGYTRGGETGVAGASPERFAPVDDRSSARDGQRFADFLGIDYAPLLHADGAQHTDYLEAVAMNRALYAGTLGYYFDQMLNEVLDDSALGELRHQFTNLVTGRGPVAAFRVGNQPYGVLPTSSLSRWQPHGTRVDAPRAGVAADPFENDLLRVLRAFDAAWTLKLSDVAQLGTASGGESGGAKNLLKVLGLQPTSAEFYQRVGYSYDYLRNLDSFTIGGTNAADVMKMFIERMGSRAVLRSLGYDTQRSDGTSKPLPALLQLIWRHYQTTLDPKQLIDGQPLSETASIKPYSSAGTNYIDWLLANASDAAALEAQNFGGASRPGALLYMMLHFALVMESGRAINRFLGGHQIDAKELVRSRKFLNVSGTSPSIWEVFRAPANRIVGAANSSQPLLTLMHAPQIAPGAGAGVKEQQAALATLRSLPTARLERTLVEHLDTLTYRLDAWQTSLFARRLQQQRRLDAPVAQRRTGAYLGAYGYLEHVNSSGRARTPVRGEDNLFRDSGNGGYVHTPSINHATAAALLRSGYLTNASAADPQALAVNLSSGRVQRASYLIEGIRNGQSLETLLGTQFERGLHDWTTRTPNPVILDQLKPAFRLKFPIVRTRVPQANTSADGASEVHEDYQVVNGLTLASTKAAFPYGIAELSALSSEQQDAIRSEKAAVEDTLDSLRDVLTAEAAYQLALGNFDRAAAVIQSTGNGTLPPDVEVLDTPRGTEISFTQRLAVQFDSTLAGNPWAPIPLSERARLEPPLNAWLGDLLGAPDTICCGVAAWMPMGRC
jgi:hypothetical protein